MSVVKRLLEHEIDMRVEQTRFRLEEIGFLQQRLHECIDIVQQNNDDIEELLDAVELEDDHIERSVS